ncbi:MAG: class I SAM-dependent methyltransferase [Planctomycetota bacterium]
MLEPAAFLSQHGAILPRGRALDVACGAGRNVLFLAEMGLRAIGVDISPAGLELARRVAMARGLDVSLVEADLTRDPLPAGPFDVVVCVHYLERSLFGALEAAVAPGGVLVYETFTQDQLAFPEAHPRRKEFLLAPQELLRAFPALEVEVYAEGTHRLSDGRRATLAQLIARRRAPRP